MYDYFNNEGSNDDVSTVVPRYISQGLNATPKTEYTAVGRFATH